MITIGKLFQRRNQQRIWQEYCGFLDLTLAESMRIQEQLLMEQIELVHDSPIAKNIMPQKPRDISEFRQLVPLTTYEDYATYLNEKNEDVLAVKPYCWARTSGRGGIVKWIPYTPKGMEVNATYAISTLILACANRKGEVKIQDGTRALHNLPPVPYGAGFYARAMTQQMDIRLIPDLETYESEDFEARIQDGFATALRTGVDILSSLSSVLIKMGERFTEQSGKIKLSRRMLHPKIMSRMIRALLWSKYERRSLLPKDLWPLKGLICYGMDTNIYRDQIKYYWGKEPAEIYVATEAGVIATQAWNKNGMTFIPYSCFREFIPEDEWLKNQEDENYQPSTVLLDQVETGKRYEVVITSFYGMPFLRYRVGDLIKIISLEDKEVGVKLPQMVFESRADGLIDIAGFTRLDEKTIWQAIANTKLNYEDWTARKEYEQDKPIIRLYIELKGGNEKEEEIVRRVHQELAIINPDYSNLQKMLGIHPLRASILPVGSFRKYYEEKQKSGADLAHLKPAHMNVSDTVIQTLIKFRSNPS